MRYKRAEFSFLFGFVFFIKRICNLTGSQVSVLEYNLPDEQDEFEKAVNGGKYAYIIWELDHFLRANTKYAPDSMPDEVHKAYEDTRDKLRSLLTENDLSI